MNIYLNVGQIINHPKLINIQNTYILILIIALPNNKRSLSFYKIQTVIQDPSARKFFTLYQKKDFILVEGYVRSKILSVNNKTNKYIEIQTNNTDMCFNPRY